MSLDQFQQYEETIRVIKGNSDLSTDISTSIAAFSKKHQKSPYFTNIG